MVAAFPAVKLGYLAFKQISKPFATRIKEQAKSSHFFRTYICMPPAQFYHWVEVNVKMRMLNLGKPSEVPKLNEAMAIELGAELLGEGIVFGVAAGCLIAEYVRSSNKEREKEEAREARTVELESRISELELMMAEQNVHIRELSRQVPNIFRFIPSLGGGSASKEVSIPSNTNRTHTTETSVKQIDKVASDRNNNNETQTDLLGKAIRDLQQTVRGK